MLQKWSSYRTAVKLGDHFYDSYQHKHRNMPIEAVRYIELAYLKKWLERETPLTGASDLSALDVSSPYVFSLYLANSLGATVTKTDVNINEARHIEQLKESINVSFQYADAKSMEFDDETFDLVTSVSVIEHIYQDYTDAIKEMIRVLKPGGYLYCTTHVAEALREEWLDHDIYAEQATKREKTFFQYRFNEREFRQVVDSLPGIEMIHVDAYPEALPGYYDFLVMALNWNWGILNNSKRKFLNIVFGLTLFKAKPKINSRSKMSNFHLILRKKTTVSRSGC